MPKQLAYLYDNTIQVYFDLGIGTTGDRRQEKMYERMLKFYKGIDNQVQFQFYNHCPVIFGAPYWPATLQVLRF